MSTIISQRNALLDTLKEMQEAGHVEAALVVITNMAPTLTGRSERWESVVRRHKKRVAYDSLSADNLVVTFIHEGVRAVNP
jgi:hypothetical protein